MQKLQFDEVLRFLKAVDTSFPVPLSVKQPLECLAQKFCEKATLCHIEENGEMVALVAGYTQNLAKNMAYISVVATLPDMRGKGYAKKLMKQFLDICEEKKIAAVHLYTDASNEAAIALYERLGFVPYVVEDEPRPEDIHLIYHFKQEQ